MRQGPTFALVCLLWLATGGALGLAGDSWSLPDDSRGSRVAPLLLLSRPEVRDDLRIAPAQAGEIDRAINEFQAKAAALRGKTGPAAVAERRAVDQGQTAWIEQHLSPDQVDRLWQVDLLWEGPASIATRASVAEALALTDEQKAALAAALRERNALRAKARDKEKDIAAANHKFGVRALGILSDAQKQGWARMVGRPIAHHKPEATASASPDRTAR